MTGVLESVTAVNVSSSAEGGSNDAENSGEENADNSDETSRTERSTEENAEQGNDVEEESNQVEGELETSQVVESVTLELGRKILLLDAEVPARVKGVVGLVLGAADEFTGLLDRLALLVTADTVEGPARNRVLGITIVASVSGEEVPLLENTRGSSASKDDEEEEQSATSQKQKRNQLERNTN